MNVLFVCTLNKARSVAAERLYQGTPSVQVRSGGTSDRAAHQVDEDDLAWADIVVTFEPSHEQWIRSTFEGDLPETHCLGIPDEFTATDERLHADIIECLTPILGRPGRR